MGIPRCFGVGQGLLWLVSTGMIASDVSFLLVQFSRNLLGRFLSWPLYAFPGGCKVRVEDGVLVGERDIHRVYLQVISSRACCGEAEFPVLMIVFFRLFLDTGGCCFRFISGFLILLARTSHAVRALQPRNLSRAELNPKP